MSGLWDMLSGDTGATWAFFGSVVMVSASLSFLAVAVGRRIWKQTSNNYP